MNYEEFKEHIKERITDYLPLGFKDSEVSIKQQQKNNNVILDALSIQGNENVTPIIYLESFYQEYKEGVAIEDVLQKIAAIYMASRRHVGDFGSNDFQFEKIKDYIFVDVCNAELNHELLEDIPHEIREDLALTYRVKVELSNTERGSILVRNSHLELWGIDEELLRETAWHNMRHQFKPTFDSIGSILGHMFDAEVSMISNTQDMYILSNKEKCNGAAYVFDEQVMGEIAERFGTDIVVLPSSIHETILLKNKPDMDYERLREMVNEVNCTHLSAEEILSNEIYLFNRETQNLSRIIMEEQVQGMNMTM